MLTAVRAAVDAPLPSRAELAWACGADVLCSATRIVQVLGPRARLQPVRHPDTDTIRWAVTAPSVRLYADEAAGRVELLRLGRKVLAELDAAIAAVRAHDAPLVLDLRQLRGGRFERMLEVAGLLVGDRRDALAVIEGGDQSWLDLIAPGPAPRVPIDRVMIGRATASAGEVLAALIAAYGGAQLCGDEATAGDAYLKAVIPVDHDWRLLVGRADIVVPHHDLRHGLESRRRC